MAKPTKSELELEIQELRQRVEKLEALLAASVQREEQQAPAPPYQPVNPQYTQVPPQYAQPQDQRIQTGSPARQSTVTVHLFAKQKRPQISGAVLD